MPGMCIWCGTTPNNGDSACSSFAKAKDCAWFTDKDRAIIETETPFPTSPLNEGAVEEARFDEIVDWLKWRSEIAAGNDNADACKSFADAAQLLTTLLTNLAKAQRERATYEDRWQSEFKLRLIAERRAEALEAQLAEAQRENGILAQALAEAGDRNDQVRRRAEAAESRLSHLQTRLEEVEGALEEVTNVLDAFGNLSDEKMCPLAWHIHGAEEAIATARAALQPKGESE